MNPRRTQIALIALIYAAAAAVYVYAGLRQMQAVNTHPAAAGQYPYLVYAQGIAREGLTDYLDDRNRMPLVPALFSLAHADDPDVFFERAKRISLVLSVAILIGIGVLMHRVLPPVAAVAATLAAVFGLAPERASVVQAELPFYGLFLASCLVVVRLLRRPDPRWAAGAGVLLALTYYAKASVLPLMASYVAIALLDGLWPAPRRMRAAAAEPPGEPLLERRAITARQEPRPPDLIAHRRRTLQSVALVIACFLLASLPYLVQGYHRFGRPFFNVNTDIVMWSDFWPQARERIDHVVRADGGSLPLRDVPGAMDYWRTHTAGQIGRRLTTGLVELVRMAARAPYGWFLFATAAGALACVLCVSRLRDPPPTPSLEGRGIRGRLSLEGRGTKERFEGREELQQTRFVAVVRGNGLIVAFALVTLGVYVVSYAWYVQVAYGDRFVQSLLLPIMAALLLLSSLLLRDRPPMRIGSWTVPSMTALSMLLAGFIGVSGAWHALHFAQRPTKTFVLFFYNECHELLTARPEMLLGPPEQRDGPAQANRGFEAITRLDPTFGPAWLGQGTYRLHLRQPDRALPLLQEAVRWMSESADALSSLGAALLESGRADEAVAALRRATELQPGFVPAWLNLCVALGREGRLEEAEAARAALSKIDAAAGERIAAWLREQRKNEAEEEGTAAGEP